MIFLYIYYPLLVKITESGFSFSYFLILIFLFLELMVRASDDITQSHDIVAVTVTSHMMHGRTKKILEEVILYNMYTTC